MPTNTETPRQESDREQIATIIQRGHIGHKTSDEIACDVIRYINKMIRPESPQTYQNPHQLFIAKPIDV